MSQAGPIPLLILADDLSGAAELAGLAYNLGLSAEVHRAPGMPAAADLLALDTDSRLLTPENAATRIHKAITAQPIASTTTLYKKTDSLLRGNVRAEIEAALEATGLSRALLIPANPSRGRTIAAGQYLIEGQPLHQTPLAADSHHPRLTSDVRSLLGDGHLEIHCPKPGDILPPTGIIIPDVTSEADLKHFAAQTDDSTLPAGAADFFQSLLLIRTHPSHPSDPCPSASSSLVASPILLVCGSRVAWPARHADCTRAGIASTTIDTTHPLPSLAGALLLGIGDTPSGDPSTLLLRLADSAAEFISQSSPRTTFIEGGATAAALAHRLHWTRFSVVATAPSGVGILRPLPSPAPLLFIKPGSYPWPPDIWNAFLQLQQRA